MKYPYIVKWAITDKCNLKCKHCFRSEVSNSTTKEDAEFFIEDMAKHKVACVALTGGEPLMSPHFWDIVKLLHEKKIHTEMATNGTLLTPEVVKRLRESNINRFQVSLEGVSSETNDFIRGSGNFKKVISAITLLKENDARVTVGVTLNHRNCRSISAFIQMKNEYKIDGLRFELFIPVNEDKFSLSLTEEDIEYIIQATKEYNNAPGVIFPVFVGGSCGAGELMVLVNCDMSVSPCDLLCDEIRSTKKISKENSLLDIMNEDEQFIWWRDKHFIGCGASIIKYKNEEDVLSGVYKNVE